MKISKIKLKKLIVEVMKEIEAAKEKPNNKELSEEIDEYGKLRGTIHREITQARVALHNVGKKILETVKDKRNDKNFDLSKAIILMIMGDHEGAPLNMLGEIQKKLEDPNWPDDRMGLQKRKEK